MEVDSVGWTGDDGLIDWVGVCTLGPPSRRDKGPFIPAGAKDTPRVESVKEDS